MSAPLPRIFIGSSREGIAVARYLQSELEASRLCEVERWDSDVFEPSGYALDSLLAVARRVDFAVLVASPDDTTVSRGDETASARDNVVLEFGLFVGALGRERTFLLPTGDLKLPTDVLGLTTLPYRARSDDNLRAAVNDAVLKVERQVGRLGRRAQATAAPAGGAGPSPVDRELRILRANAEAQGWIVKTDSPTTLRLKSPRGEAHTMNKGTAEATRANLRVFARELRAAGLRVNRGVRVPVDESPF